jgi:hypothetical protein
MCVHFKWYLPWMHVDLQKSFCKLNGLRLQQGFLTTVGNMQIQHFDVGNAHSQGDMYDFVKVKLNQQLTCGI